MAQEATGWTGGADTGPRHCAAPAAPESVDGLVFFRTVPPPKTMSPIGELREIGAFAARIGEAIDAFKPDLLHAHSPVLDALAALRVARRRGLHLLYEIRAFWEDAAVGKGTGGEGQAG